ncbi:hypothetical protein HDE_06689 [Halotydeus destructor]|nr:hypothetical protein HDE_06689 [Halotydeus destructor]
MAATEPKAVDVSEDLSSSGELQRIPSELADDEGPSSADQVNSNQEIEDISEPDHDSSQRTVSTQITAIGKVVGVGRLVLEHSLSTITSDIVIINDTNCIMNVCIKAVTPMRYKNRLMPGRCWNIKAPKFIYTIEARVWTGNNEYNAVSDSVVPVSLIVLTAASFAVSTVARTAVIASRAPWVARALRYGRTVFQAGRTFVATKATKEVAAGMFSRAAVRSHGWNFTRDRKLVICGGPAVEITPGENGELHQFIELGEQFDGFKIVEFDSVVENCNSFMVESNLAE